MRRAVCLICSVKYLKEKRISETLQFIFSSSFAASINIKIVPPPNPIILLEEIFFTEANIF